MLLIFITRCAVLLSVCIAPLAMAAVTGSAQVQYPTKPVRIIAASTGTSGDLLARYLGQRLSERWGQPVVIENRSGLGGVIAGEVAARAAPGPAWSHRRRTPSRTC